MDPEALTIAASVEYGVPIIDIRAVDFSNYPLPEPLTRRVVTYLTVFRLFISFVLMIAFFTGLLVRAYFLDSGAIAGMLLISYFVLAIYLAIEARRRAAHQFFLAKYPCLPIFCS